MVNIDTGTKTSTVNTAIAGEIIETPLTVPTTKALLLCLLEDLYLL